VSPDLQPSTVALLEEDGGDESALPRGKRPPLTKDEIVARNCRLVRDAAEAWALEAGGEYPWFWDSRSPAGHTLIDLLPNGRFLVNPYDNGDPQPGPFVCSEDPGDIAYLGYARDGHDITAYLINGVGLSGEICRYQKNWPGIGFAGLDSLVVRNCRFVQKAAERFAMENNGEYPMGMWDQTTLGHQVADFLPDRVLLMNPYTSAATEPRDCPAACPGEIGYLSVEDQHGRPEGYVINGCGSCFETIITIVGPAERPAMRKEAGDIPNS